MQRKASAEWKGGLKDGKGAVFLLNARDIAEAKSIMESLPLAKEDILDHEYVPVGPLMPLRLLLGSP